MNKVKELMMTVHSFPRIRTLAPTMIVVLVGLIVDLNLKQVGFEYDYGSVSHRWLNQAYVSLADKLMNETQQPGSSPTAPIPGSMTGTQDQGSGFMQPRSLAGAAAVMQTVGQGTTSKTRVCVAPAQAQFGQGNTLQDHGTAVRNALILMMRGPVLDTTALDANVAIQMDAEAHQKQCDYVLSSAVSVKHAGSGNLGRLMKAGSMAATFTPMGMIAHGMSGMIAAQAANAAMQSAMMTAQQQAVSQLSGFNGQIKSKDEVTVEYRLVAVGQTQAKLQNVLKGKSKTDGEDVLSPLLRETANGVLNEVAKPENGK